LTTGGWRRWLPPALGGRAEGPPGRLAFLHLPRTGGTAVQHRLESLLGEEDVARIELPSDFPDHLAELRSRRVVVGHFLYPVVRLVDGAELATVIREPVERSISAWEYLQWRTTHPDHELLVSRGITSLEQFLEDPDLVVHVRDNQTRLLGAECDVEGIAASLEKGQIDPPEAHRLAAAAEEASADGEMLNRAVGRLERMSVVGLTEELPDFVSRLERRLGLSGASELRPDNATPAATVALRAEAYDGGIRDRLAELNRFDAQLYAFARELCESRRERSAPARESVG
jgi:hypothetical protein